jgi:hypothetical protein
MTLSQRPILEKGYFVTASLGSDDVSAFVNRNQWAIIGKFNTCLERSLPPDT